MQTKKAFWNCIFLIVVFGLTIYGIFHGQDLEKMMSAIKNTDVRWILAAIFLVLFFIWGESIIIWYMMRSFQVHIKKRICFLFSSVGFFFSCITPSATGGQPMQIYYMKKEKIPIPFATVILMIITITYKLVLVIVGIGIPIVARGFMNEYLVEILPVFYLGLLLNVFCISFMTLLVFHPVFAEKIILKCMYWMEWLHILKHKETRILKFQNSMQIYRETAAYLKEHKQVIVYVIFITFVQRFALFTVTYMVYLAFGMSGTNIWDIIFLQAVISISVDMLPLPGGMGISESLFLKIFSPVCQSVTLPAMVVSRGLSYYSQLLISALFTIVAQIYYTMKNNKRIENQTGGYK